MSLQDTQLDIQEGVVFDTHTYVPDVYFDSLLSKLTGNQAKVLWFICRMTLGFHRISDSIALHQFINGLSARPKPGDERPPFRTRGTGLGKSIIARDLNSLVDLNLIKRVRQTKLSGKDTYTSFTLNTRLDEYRMTDDDGWVVRGARRPKSTPGPNEYFDELMYQLPGCWRQSSMAG